MTGDGTALVRQLLAAQFPRWASLPVLPVREPGVDNTVFRLGEDLVVRLPRNAGAAAQVDRDQQWLPRLGPQLPLAVPQPEGRGRPGLGHPYAWAVHTWLPGTSVAQQAPADPRRFAADLGGFVAALRAADATGAPPSGRGRPLPTRDRDTRAAIEELRGEFDPRELAGVWEAALAVPVWDGPPVWCHGDLEPGNLLVREGRLSGVLDFGALGAGDPAGDLRAAWTVVPAAQRPVFRQVSGADEAGWARGRGWALSVALHTLACYRSVESVLVKAARHTVAEVLRDRG